MAVVDLLLVEKSLAAVLEAGPDTNIDGGISTDQGVYTPEEAYRAILTADAMVCNWLIDTIKNGSRGSFLGNSASIANGGRIPPHPGKMGVVEIQLADSTWVAAIEAPSISALRMWQSNPTLFPSADCQGRCIVAEEDTLYYIGSDARLRLAPQFVIDRTSNGGKGACQSPSQHTGAVFRGALSLMPRLFTAGLVQDARDGFKNDEIAVRSGGVPAPIQIR